MISIWRENMQGYLSPNIEQDEKRTVFREPEVNCELRGKGNVQRQIFRHIFAPNGGCCVNYPSNIFRNTRALETGN